MLDWAFRRVGVSGDLVVGATIVWCGFLLTFGLRNRVGPSSDGSRREAKFTAPVFDQQDRPGTRTTCSAVE